MNEGLLREGSTADPTQTPSESSCCSNIKHELSSSTPIFSLSKPSGDVIDVEKSFAPPRKFHLTIILRAVFLALSLFSLGYKIVVVWIVDYWRFVLYLTHWTFAVSIAYQATALYVTILRSNLVQPEETDDGKPTFPIRLMSTFYAIAAPAGTSVFAIYWGLEYNPVKHDIDFANITFHGLVAATVLIDGILVCSVPVRAKHFLILTVYSVVYVLFNIFYEFVGNGDGDWPGEDPNDPREDSLYISLSWSEDLKGAVSLTALQLLVINPFFFFVVWSLSLLRRPTFVPGSVSGNLMDKA